MSKPILSLDFDGVCHSYTSGWKGVDVIPDPPVDGMAKFLWAAATEFEIHIFSSRSHQKGGIDAMKKWFDPILREWIKELPSDVARAEPLQIDLFRMFGLHFPTVKPPALVGIDDRVITFTGVWPHVDDLRHFKPWNKS